MHDKASEHASRKTKTEGNGKVRPHRKRRDRAHEELSHRDLLAALRAFKRGEFGHRLREDLTGLDGQICEAFNALVDQAESMHAEFASLRQSVGREGRTQRRMRLAGFPGGWGRTLQSVNELLDDLSVHTDGMARVVDAVSRGDLSQTIDLEGVIEPLHGDFLKRARAVNGMVEQLSLFGSEVTRVAQEVGVDGALGARARVPGVSGTWKELTDSVNLMASNLTSQVREIAHVTTAVAQGDLTKTVNIEVKGEFLELKNTINTMVEQLSSFADEVTRVAREVGTEGRLGGQAQVRGVSGVWRELTENVNSMANNLTFQVRNIAEVATAIAEGDLSRTITVDAKGEILELKNTINTMVDTLSSFSGEVTRVAREVGTEGVLGGQAQVAGVSGVWRELTENVNGMATNLTNQVRNIAEVATAIAEGDLGRKITVDAKGEILSLKNTINSTVDKLNHFSEEVTRVARLVGTAGTLGVQAEVKDVSGIWKELTDNVNSMADNLTNQVRNIAEVTTAVANGDLSKKITVEVKGEILELKNTINEMVDSLGFFADEVTRMAREVGTEGVLGGQAKVGDVSGIWRELTDNVNSMASNLTNQVRNIAEVARAVAGGDLGKKITVDAKGEVLDLKETLNDMVDQLSRFGAEVTRVAREVGVDGKLGGQAEVAGVLGIWKELTDNVNMMASNLTNQVRDIAEVTTAVAKGDLTRKIVVDARGEILELKNTVNTMVDQLSSFADEVTRLASEVGVEGKLGGQADVRGVSGTWRDLTDAVNSMASNLTDQVRSISEVASAIAQGDLRKKIIVDARGEILELKNTINTMVDQLSSFAEEVTRVSRDVGTEGQLGGQASVEGVRGTWKELTDSVNLMARNLTNQVRDILQVATAIARGDLRRKVTVEVRGELLELKNTINMMVDQLSSFADEVTRVARDVGVEGKLGGQAEVRGASGIWRELTDNVNMMASNLTYQVRDIAEVTTAVATGDLSKKITVEVRGEILELKNTINTMVDQLSSFADEVTRVAREVGTEGILGGQAEVQGVSGTWRELTDNVNEMAKNLTSQVRGIARVVTAVANGDLKQELRLETKGEIATLVQTINDMLITLSTFGDQVSGVARDVGVEGKLGGQADVPGAAGIWRDLTNNVNELAGNLTRQVRAIGDVATAVTKGDLTQAINVEARGEVAILKDNINQMIRTLAETTRVNNEQDWLKTNLTRFTRMLQGQRDLLTVADQVLSELAPVVEAQHGAFYMTRKSEIDQALELFASYAYEQRRRTASRFAFGEGLVGQAARERKRILVQDVPPDYVRICSALGETSPLNIVVVPVLFEGEVKAVIELASVHRFTENQLAFIDQLIDSLGIVIATIEATMRTDELLSQSQSMAIELKTQQEELQQTNEELEEKARQLTTQKDEVERKNHEVELAKLELEEKADQLAVTSRYKSQFLANMSHELRTPLNSLLILSHQLAENRKANLDDSQVEYAETIHQAGSDLLTLINEILDLAKVESGTMAVDLSEVRLEDLREYVERSFRQVAEEKNLTFSVEVSPELPEVIVTDDMRYRQVMRNLLSNAVKFTEHGSIRVHFGRGRRGREDVLATSVTDTGIGIAKDKHQIIFEAFQQAEGGTSRTYGGTGLGLSISREIAFLLGGEIRVRSEPGKGSTFTLYLPFRCRHPVEEALPVLLPEVETPTIDQSLEQVTAPGVVTGDRADVEPAGRVLLAIENDDRLASLLLERSRNHGFKGRVAATGCEALDLARSLGPTAIALDPRLPDMNGWALLDRLKRDPSTRHVPVQIFAEADELRAIEMGALSIVGEDLDSPEVDDAFLELREFLAEPDRRLLVAAHGRAECDAILDVLREDDVDTTIVRDVEGVVSALEDRPFDCMVLDPALPGLSVPDLSRVVQMRPWRRRLPILLYGDEAAEHDGPSGLLHTYDSVVVKSAQSPEHLLDEAARFLHLLDGRLPDAKRRMLRSVLHRDPSLLGKTILVVDDDARNVFVTAALLEEHGMTVVCAENGKQALTRLSECRIDGVLMDIMMPEMDGYEATRAIRSLDEWKSLPVIALTAKAMEGDREECLEAGASDYINKPVDPDQLVSLLRVWLRKR